VVDFLFAITEHSSLTVTIQNRRYISRYWSNLAIFKEEWVTLSANYRWKVISPTKLCWYQKTRVTRNTLCGTWYLPLSRVHKSIAELCSFFGDSAITKGQIAYFSLRMRETAIILFPVKNLTSPSCSPTRISYLMQEFWRFVDFID